MTREALARVLVVDDHPIVRNGLTEFLGHSGEFDVVGQAEDGVEAVRMAGELRPEAVLMDVLMPRKDGVEACREIMELLPETRVLMLTASTEEEAVVEAVAAGAAGYLMKDSRLEELLTALRDVLEGRLMIPEQTLRRVFSSLSGDARPVERRPSSVLTARERGTLSLFAVGRTYREIAAEQEISLGTVRNAINRIQDKVGVPTKRELVVWAVKSGLLDAELPGE